MATIISSVSGNTVTFTVQLAPGDPQDWEILTSSNVDFGLGLSGQGGDYPYMVEAMNGTGNKTFSRVYPPGKYVTLLALYGVGPVDFTYFVITQPVAPGQLYTIHWSAQGLGQVNVYKNGEYVDAVIGNGATKTFTFNIGDVAKYQAVPAQGWVYVTTCGAGTCDSTNPFEGTITGGGEYTFASLFGQPAVTSVNITTYVTGSGTVHVSGSGQAADVTTSKMITFTKGDVVTWLATPASGWKFDHWASATGATSTANPFSATAMQEGTMTAVFVPVTAPPGTFVNIQISAGTGGQVQVFQNGKDLGYFRGTKTIIAASGDAISVWADADSGYALKSICTPAGACTTARPFNFTANMNISMTVTFQSTGAAPPGVAANKALVISLAPLSWADLTGLTQYLPNIAKTFADAITLYGILGITVVKSSIENGNLVIYYNQATTGTTGGIETADYVPSSLPYVQLRALPQHRKIGFMRPPEYGSESMAPGGTYSPGWAVPEQAKVGFMEEYPYCTPYCLSDADLKTMQAPQEVAIPAAIITIATIALRFGFLIIGWYVVNLLTKAVEVQKTQADTAQSVATTIESMCKSGQLSADKCAEALTETQKKKEECWISNPLGGCILSASTGKTIVGTIAVVGILGAAYWLATRHPAEVRAIAGGARRAVSGELERVRAVRGVGGVSGGV